MTATFNLLQLQSKPEWYDHLDQVEAAMRWEDEKHKIRTEFGWDCDEGGYFGPHPLKPGEVVLERDWEDETGLPLPEYMRESDYFLLELYKAFSQEPDTVSGLQAVAEKAAKYCRIVGTDGINSLLRTL